MPSRWRAYSQKSLPACGGVYVVVGSGVRPVVYVGFSQNIRHRFTNGHRQYPPWGIHGNNYTVLVSQCARYGEGLMREARLIRRLQPWANTRGKL